MHCLVTGATGYLGRALVPALLAEGHAVTGQCASAVPPGTAWSPLQCDFLEHAADIVPAGVECVFHLAGIAHQAADPASYYRVNVAATLELARDARAKGVRRFVFVSSVKAGAVQEAGGADQAASAGGVRDYASSKAAAEAGLREICRDGAMELVLLRPALVYSADAPGHLALLKRWVERRLPQPPVGGGRSMIARQDLVSLLLRLATVPLPSPPPTAELLPPLIVTDGEVYTTRRLHSAFVRALGRPPLLPGLPRAVWRVGAALRDRVQRLPAGSSWERLVGEEHYPSQGLEAFGFVPTQTFESSLGLAA